MPYNRPLVILARHGRTTFNGNRLRAWEDVPLDSDGNLDAQLAGEKLKQYKPQIIYHSDFLRDTQTAEIISEKLGNIPVEVDFAIRTANMGVLSGAKEDEVRDRVLRWYQNPWEPAPSGESYNNFVRRWMGFYDEKLKLARNLEAFCPLIIVTHGRNIAALHAHYGMMPPEEAEMPLPGGIAIVRESDDGMEEFSFESATEPVQKDA